jgi:hypothetical protein
MIASELVVVDLQDLCYRKSSTRKTTKRGFSPAVCVCKLINDSG